MGIETKRFVNALEQGAGQLIGQRQAQLGKGQCASHEEYKKVVGEIRGIEMCIALARDMLRQLEIAEDQGLEAMQDQPAQPPKKGKRS